MTRCINKLCFLFVGLLQTICSSPQREAIVGDIVDEDTVSYTICFFATWDAESVYEAKRAGKLFVGNDSLILVSLDSFHSITQEIVRKEKLDVKYDTLLYYYDDPKKFRGFIYDEDSLMPTYSAFFVKNGRVKMRFKKN